MLERSYEVTKVREFTEEQVKQEDKFLQGLPRFNIGAFLLPPIWGPAHGIWVTILYYPVWIFVDNLFYATYQSPTVLSVTLSILAFLLLLGITVAFAIVSQPFAAHRAEAKGVSRSQYLKHEKAWAMGCVIGGVVMLSLATYYNLAIRPFV